MIAAGGPFAKSRIHGILQRGATFRDGADFRTKSMHTIDIRSLSRHIDRTHENFTFHAEKCSDSGRGDTVHARTSFGNEAFLAHAASQQGLPHRVVDLVCSCMI